MRRAGRWIVVLAAGLACAAATHAQPPGGGRRPSEDRGRGRPSSERRPPQPGQARPGTSQEQSKLIAEQKKQIEDLQKEMNAKIREIQAKLDRLLTPEQRRPTQETLGRGGRPGRRGGPPRQGEANRRSRTPGGRRPGFGQSASVPARVLPSFVRDRLKLTEEQKKKIEELEKDVSAKMSRILTGEQKRELRAMRDRMRGPGRPGGPPRSRSREERPSRPPERPGRS